MKEIVLERKLDVMLDNIIISLEKKEYNKAYNLLHFYKKNAKIIDETFVDFMLINACINIKKYEEAQKLIKKFKCENKNQELLDFINSIEKELLKFKKKDEKIENKKEIEKIKSMLNIIQRIKNIIDMKEINNNFTNKDNFKIINETEDFEIANIILNLSYFRLKNILYLIETNKKTNELINIMINDPINLILLKEEDLKKILKNKTIYLKNKILFLVKYFLLKRILLNELNVELIEENKEIYNELILLSTNQKYIENYDFIYQIIFMGIDLNIEKKEIIKICQYFFDDIKLNEKEEKKILEIISEFLLED